MTTTTTPTSAGIPVDTFAARLMLARMHAGNLTYTQAADLCGLSRENWANWERGKQPRDKADVARKVAAGLGVNREWLMWGGPLAEHPKGGPGLPAKMTMMTGRPYTPTQPDDRVTGVEFTRTVGRPQVLTHQYGGSRQ